MFVLQVIKQYIVTTVNFNLTCLNMLHYEIAIILVYFKIYSQIIAKREPFTVWLILLYVFFKKYKSTVLDLLWGK